jgi:hypothetical protein
MESLTDDEISVLYDVFVEVQDKLRHYTDGEMGWDAEEIATFHGLNQTLWDDAKRRKLWWAR